MNEDLELLYASDDDEVISLPIAPGHHAMARAAFSWSDLED